MESIFAFAFCTFKQSDMTECAIYSGVGGVPYLHRFCFTHAFNHERHAIIKNCVLKPSKQSVIYKKNKEPTHTHLQIKLLRHFYSDLTFVFLHIMSLLLVG